MSNITFSMVKIGVLWMNTESEENNEKIEEQSPNESQIKSFLKWFTLKNISIFLLMTVVYFIVFELFVRILPYNPGSARMVMSFINHEWTDSHTYVTDLDLFWRFRPNQEIECHTKDDEFYKIPINNIGFQGGDFPDSVPDNAFRIMFLGDSCVFGWEVPPEKNIPNQVMNNAKKAYPHQIFHTFNGGTPGYSSYQAKTVLRLFGKQYNPHLVIVYVGTGDALPKINNTDLEIAHGLRKNLLLGEIIDKSKLLSTLRAFFYYLNRQMSDNSDTIDWSKALPRVSFDEYKSNMTDMINFSRNEIQSEIVLVTRQHNTPIASVFKYNKILRKLAQEKNVLYVEVEKLISNQQNPTSLYVENDEIHMNEEGSELVGEYIFKCIDDEGIFLKKKKM